MPRLPKNREPWFVFLFFFLAYMATSCGDLLVDSEVRWTVAKRIVDTGWFDLPAGATNLIAEGRDGRHYSFYGPGQSACFVPFVVTGRWLAMLPIGRTATADEIGQFLASLVFFPLCGAVCILLMYQIVVDLTGDRRTGRLAALVLGLATYHWQHTVNTCEESQVGVCVLLSLWAVQRAWQRGGWRYPIIACVPMGVAMCFRPTSLLVHAPMGLVALGYSVLSSPNRDERLKCAGRWIVAALIGVGPFVLFMGWLNAVRFGWATTPPGRPGHLAFQASLVQSLAGMLFSPGKSIFLFNPVLVASLLGVAGLWKMHRGLAVMVPATFIPITLFHAKYSFWAGDPTWGVRYLACVMGVAVLPLTSPLCRRPLRPALAVLIGLSFCIQAASVAYSYGLEFFQNCQHGNVPDYYTWDPAQSQLVQRFRNIGLHAMGRPNYESIPPPPDDDKPPGWFFKATSSPEAMRLIHTPFFFPFKAYAYTKDARIQMGLLILWGMIVLACVYTAAVWRKQIRNQESPFPMRA